MLEDADLFGFIRAGAYADTYDQAAEIIFPKLSKDLSISQIQNIVWEAFYQDFCVCTVGGAKDPWILDKDSAGSIIGSPERFKGIALNVRHDILK